MKRLSIIILIFLFCHNLYAQEQTAFSGSIYGGLSNVAVNPAFMTGGLYKWDLVLCGAHLNVDNNFIKIQGTNGIKLLSGSDNFQQAIAPTDLYASSADKPTVFQKNNNFNKTINAGFYVQGPSVMYNYGTWSVALTTAFRGYSSVTKVEDGSADRIFNYVWNSSENDNFGVPHAKINAMAWNEVAFGAANRFYDKNNFVIKAGAMFKILSGYGASYLSNTTQAANYELNNDLLEYQNMEVDAGFALPNGFENPLHRAQAYGFGVDLGISFEKRKTDNFGYASRWKEEKENQHQWKLGISLLDLGKISFREGTYAYLIRDTVGNWDVDNFSNIENVNQLDRSVKESFYLARRTFFSMSTPRALSLQFDYNLGHHFFVNTTVVQNISRNDASVVKRSNVLSVTGRYELPRFGVSVSTAFYNYNEPRIGVAFRLNNFLTIGTDNLLNTFGSATSGMDLFFTLKLNSLLDCRKKIGRTAIPCSRKL